MTESESNALQHMVEFVRHAVPLVYKIKRDGAILFLGGGFERLFSQAGVEVGTLHNFRDVMRLLGLQDDDLCLFHRDRGFVKSQRVAAFSAFRKVNLSQRATRPYWVGRLAYVGR